MNRIAFLSAMTLGVCTTTANSSIMKHMIDSNDQPKIQESTKSPTKKQQINASIRKTRLDSNYEFFVVCLPEDKAQSRLIHQQWAQHTNVFEKHNAPVFFVQGKEAEDIKYQAITEGDSVTIVFREGVPFHVRSGTFTDHQLTKFINHALNDHAQPTPSPDQVSLVFERFEDLVESNELIEAADMGCDHLYAIHLLVDGRYANTYTSQNIIQMHTDANQLILDLSTLVHQDSKVKRVIDTNREAAKEQWAQKGSEGIVGIQYWIDLAFLTESEYQVISWIQDTITSPTTVSVLETTGSSLIDDLYKHEMWEAIAHTFNSVDSLESIIKYNNELIVSAPDMSNAIRSMNESVLEEALIYHGALLVVDRDQEAWDIIAMLSDHFDLKRVGIGACMSASKAQSVTYQHITIAKEIDPDGKMGLMETVQTASFSGPEFD